MEHIGIDVHKVESQSERDRGTAETGPTGTAALAAARPQSIWSRSCATSWKNSAPCGQEREGRISELLSLRPRAIRRAQQSRARRKAIRSAAQGS
jgi:hypothetical protein